MRWPGGGGDEVAVGVGVVESGAGGDEFAARELDFMSAGGIGADFASFDDSRCREKLRAVADGSDWLFGRCEVLDDREDARSEAEVLRRAAAGDDEGVVRLL